VFKGGGERGGGAESQNYPQPETRSRQHTTLCCTDLQVGEVEEVKRILKRKRGKGGVGRNDGGRRWVKRRVMGKEADGGKSIGSGGGGGRRG